MFRARLATRSSNATRIAGLEGLTDRSRRPYRQANQLPFQIEKLIVQLKRERPSWGAPKIREKLRRLHSDIPTPAISTVHAVLDRHDLVNHGVFERAFKEFGLPQAIRTHNGVPFASPHALFGLSKLAVWWLRLGIPIERIKPAPPQQNRRHERMHLTLKQEATKPAAQTFLQQQAKFDDFVECYNHKRPHQALGMKYPADLYRRSPHPYRVISELQYPFHDRTITITQCGRICVGRRKINLSTVFAGQDVGIKEVSDNLWLVSFMQYDLGFFDHETARLASADNPFPAKVLPMSPAPCAPV